MNPEVRKIQFLKSCFKFVNFFGFDPRILYHNLTGLLWFLKDVLAYKKQSPSVGAYNIKSYWPILTDKSDNAGVMSGQYFFQDIIIAKKVFQNNPIRHVDIGSRIDGFVAHVACFRKIEVIDIRALESSVDGVEFLQIDFMKPLEKKFENYTDSLSCLHAMEHFGLGRYGDPIDYNGYVKGIENLYKILKPGGKLYFSVPMGPDRTIFNAQRIFSTLSLFQLFDKNYSIDDFYYVDDFKMLHHPSIQNNEEAIKNNFGCYNGCGIIELTKLENSASLNKSISFNLS